MAPAMTLPRPSSFEVGADEAPSRGRWVWIPALLAVGVRLPFVGAPAGDDEAGFLQVAHQWTSGGGSLYGRYWVDRPPLLITLYQLADLAGGVVALRLLGCVAVAITVLLSARAAGLLAGRHAARWTAVMAAALLVSPLLGSAEVNGELLAAPFVAAGVLALVEASRTRDRRRAVLLAGAGGAAGLCAMTVKQNIADVFVFGAVFLAAGAFTRTVPNVRLLLGGALAGAATALGVVGAWTLAHGTSLVGVFDAMYPFRLRAAQVVAAGGSQYASERAVHIALAWVASGLALATVSLVASTGRRGWRDPAMLGLAAAAAFDAASVALGGGYWLHYLVEMVVPLAVWAGVLAARGKVIAQISAVVVAGAAVIALATGGLPASTSTAQQVGSAIALVKQPGDTLTTLYGDAPVNFAAGMPSPYVHLWSLPVKTLDPQLVGLDTVLSGSDAPTWVVVTHAVSSWGLETERTQAILAADYHPVAEIDGQTIYLHDGITRGTPILPESAGPSRNQELS